MPEGMSYEGVFGKENRLQVASASMSKVFDRGFAGARVHAMPAPAMESRAEAPPPLARPQGQAPASNLDPVIAALIARVKSGYRPSVDESRFVFGDEAYIRLTLNDQSPDAIDQLRKAGLVITAQQGGTVQGHIAIARLEALSKLTFVQRLAPR
jgi:hypothetical protein